MDSSVRLGRVAGIEVGLHWSLAIIFVLIVWTLAGQVFPVVVPDQPQCEYWLVSVVAAMLFYVSLLGHEMGHALIATLGARFRRTHGASRAFGMSAAGSTRSRRRPRANRSLQCSIVSAGRTRVRCW